jgi:hypothetical protein
MPVESIQPRRRCDGDGHRGLEHARAAAERTRAGRELHQGAGAARGYGTRARVLHRGDTTMRRERYVAEGLRARGMAQVESSQGKAIDLSLDMVHHRHGH